MLARTAADVFGVHPVAPGARYDSIGLVPLINGGDIVSVSPRSAIIKTKSTGASLTYLQTPQPGALSGHSVLPGIVIFGHVAGDSPPRTSLARTRCELQLVIVCRCLGRRGWDPPERRCPLSAILVESIHDGFTTAISPA